MTQKCVLHSKICKGASFNLMFILRQLSSRKCVQRKVNNELMKKIKQKCGTYTMVPYVYDGYKRVWR